MHSHVHSDKKRIAYSKSAAVKRKENGKEKKLDKFGENDNWTQKKFQNSDKKRKMNDPVSKKKSFRDKKNQNFLDNPRFKNDNDESREKRFKNKREGRNFEEKKRFSSSLKERSFREEKRFKEKSLKSNFAKKEEVFEERIAKRLSRIGIASRRDAELMILSGRIKVNGKLITSPATNIKKDDQIFLDGKKLPMAEKTRLWLYHKPKGLVTTAKDPENRPTVFESLPKQLPRVLSVGRLDINTEGLLLLTNDGGLKRILELPTVGWGRCYRVRAFGKVTQDALDRLRDGIAIDGIFYGSIEAKIEKEQGSNVWLNLKLREGKNREIKNVLQALGLTVNRLIRTSYGPFQLADLAAGDVLEVHESQLQEQLGVQIIEQANADFNGPVLKAFSFKKELKKEKDTNEQNIALRSRSGNVWFASGSRSYKYMKSENNENGRSEKKFLKKRKYK